MGLFQLSPAIIISRVITLIIAFSVHEFAHAFSADRLGDSTPRYNGRLTLNPLSHLDLMGTLMLILVGFGWAKPVPINPYALNRRSRWGTMLVSLAGPLSNLALAILGAIPLRLGLVPVERSSGFLPTGYEMLITFIMINILLFIFNLIPLAPLDGEKVIEGLLPPQLSSFFDKIRPYSPMILLVLILVLPRVGFDVLGWIMYPLMSGILRILLGVNI